MVKKLDDYKDKGKGADKDENKKVKIGREEERKGEEKSSVKRSKKREKKDRTLLKKIQTGLYNFSDIEQKYCFVFLIFFLILTTFATYGALRLELQSDLSQFAPEDLPITELNEKATKMFSSSDSIIVLLKLKEGADRNRIKDIRDPKVLNFLKEFDKRLQEDELIEESFSLATFLKNAPTPRDLEESKILLEQIEGSNRIISSDYTFTTMFISANIGASTQQINAANDRIKEIVEETTPPGDIEVVVTGEPALGARLFSLMISDSITVLIYAIIFIFILLIITEWSIKRAFFALTPLLFGLTWTAGAMGWLGIPITIATAGLSAMLLGLGVEYSIFLIERYKEEKKENNTREAVNKAISNVGSSVFSSGGTTAIGFFALSLSIFPALSDMGKSLGIGISMILLSTITITPIIIQIETKIEEKLGREKKEKKKKTNLDKYYRGYAKALSNHPGLALIIVALITAVAFYGITNITNSDVDFDTVLPEDLEELGAFRLIESDYGETSSSRLYVYIEPGQETKDIRERDSLEFIDILTKKVNTLKEVYSVSSITGTIRQTRKRLPRDKRDKIFENPQIRDMINSDFSGTIIEIEASPDVDSNPERFLQELEMITRNTKGPKGMKAEVIGSLAVQEEQNKEIGRDSSRTSLIALGLIVFFLFILTLSIKKTILPLITVALGITWTLGFIGLFKIPFNSITSSVITMTIGIGIDFGLQLMTRFDYELKNKDKKIAMQNTLTALATPLLITVISAVIGFRAMNLGQLSLLRDLGTTMSIAVTASMLASITGVAALILLFEKNKKRS